MRDVRKNLLVTLTGLVATVIVLHLMFKASYLAPNVPFGILITFLLCMPSLGIGYFATRFPMSQSGFVLFAGQIIVMMLDYAPAIYPGRHILPREVMLANMRQDLVFVATACILAYLGAWLRNRMNKQRDRNPDAAPR